MAGVLKPVSIAALGDNIFWTTFRKSRLYYTSKHNLGGTKKMVIEQEKGSSSPEEIVLQTVTPLTTSEHPCQRNLRGGCSHICVAVGQSNVACLCPIGMTFNDHRNQTCVDTKQCEYRLV